jgi:hypothetical protein
MALYLASLLKRFEKPHERLLVNNTVIQHGGVCTHETLCLLSWPSLRDDDWTG